MQENIFDNPIMQDVIPEKTDNSDKIMANDAEGADLHREKEDMRSEIVPKEEVKEFIEKFRNKLSQKAEQLGIKTGDLNGLYGIEDDAEFSEKIRNKASKLGISEQDLEILASINMDELNDCDYGFTRSDFEVYKDILNNDIDSIGTSKKHSKVLEFVKNHRTMINIAQLVLYLSAMGPFAMEHSASGEEDDSKKEGGTKMHDLPVSEEHRMLFKDLSSLQKETKDLFIKKETKQTKIDDFSQRESAIEKVREILNDIYGKNLK